MPSDLGAGPSRSLPRLLAGRGARRSPRRFRAQVLAILLCALLVMAVDGFGRGLLIAYRAQSEPQAPYRLYIWVRQGDTAALRQSLLAAARKAGAGEVWISQRAGSWDAVSYTHRCV